MVSTFSAPLCCLWAFDTTLVSNVWWILPFPPLLLLLLPWLKIEPDAGEPTCVEAAGDRGVEPPLPPPVAAAVAAAAAPCECECACELNSELCPPAAPLAPAPALAPSLRSMCQTSDNSRPYTNKRWLRRELNIFLEIFSVSSLQSSFAPYFLFGNGWKKSTKRA
jgi:hypothetical protein